VAEIESINPNQLDSGDELALVKEFAGVEHLISYAPFVEQTPVGFVLTGISGMAQELGITGIVFVSLLMFFVVMLFAKQVIILLFLMIALFGMTWIAAGLLTSNTVIKADYSGISLPLIFFTSTNGQLDRHWSELKDIVFMRDGMPSYEPVHMVFRFHDGVSVSLLIDGFTRADFERLLLVINTYCPKVRIRPEINELSSSIMSKGRTTQALSFTELWQQELGSRFGTTAFVPHESGDRLNDGTIRIIGQVAFGGLSAVYLAERNGKDTVILKEAVLPESADDQTRTKCVELFEREAQLLSRIDHPRIASVYDFFVENQRHYMVLEYIEGKNLRTFINDYGPQPENKVAIWGDEIVDILEYLHSLSPPVIHRDLTPDNMIISRDGSITVVDFGAANDFLGTATGTVVGKNAYIPIEQFRGKSTLKSDIYAFGCTIYFLLMGRDPEPFSESSPRATGANVSASIDKLVRDCTKVEASERLVDAKSLHSRTRQLRKDVS
jgi:tRNA A-37 threonylcarbamoyl transferase component Bud32